MTMANEAESSAESASQTWVDRLRMVPLSGGASAPSMAGAKSDASDGSGSSRSALEFNVASFNVLAESYLTPRSHPGLPERYADVAFDPSKRRKLLVDTLERFCNPDRVGPADQWDVLALQELDLVGPDESILPALGSWGYRVVTTSTDKRKDKCAIAFDARKFALVNHEVVQFDDLATLQSANEGGEGTKGSGDGAAINFHNITPKRNSQPELTGMVRSFLRRNCAVVAHLKSVETGQSLVVASVHLYWHPGYEYVKLCQAKYLLDRVSSFAFSEQKGSASDATIRRVPTLICGDMNSKPGSIVHKLFEQKHVDARAVAPWRYFWDEDNEVMYTESIDGRGIVPGDRVDGQDPIDESSDGDDSEKKVESIEFQNATDSSTPSDGYMMNGLSADFSMLCRVIDPSTEANENNKNAEQKTDDISKEAKRIPSETNGDDINANYEELKATLAYRRMNKHTTPQDYQHSTPPPPVKYHLDYTLNRFTRWLRILGIDATLETVEEENERTSGGNIALFDYCKNEKRTLLTTSYKLLLRKDCPPGAYLLDPKSTSQLEQALPRLLRTHGVDLSPRTFLTRCVVCNGSINRVSTTEEKNTVFREHGAPGLVDSNEVIEVFRCDGCSQGYWWDDRPSSSASRVFTQATKLLRLCLRAGVGLKDEDVAESALAPDEHKMKLIMGAFDFVDVAKERQQSDNSLKGESEELAVIEWLREERLASPFALQSAYASPLPFSNVTKEFVGCLDYIFFEAEQFEQLCALKVPTSFREMNDRGVFRGHLLPSDVWPSDHLAVGARLRLKQSCDVSGGERNVEQTSNVDSATDRNSIHNSANPKCACGCVPNILSLFEMAELRKQMREKKAKEAAENL